MNVLIVDEDIAVADLNRRYLEHIRGFRCYASAYTGQQAKNILRRSHLEIDLVLLNGDILQRNGVDLLATIRDYGERIPVILMSSRHDFRGLTMALEQQGYSLADHLITPFQFSRLEHKLSAYREKAAIYQQRQWLAQQADIEALTEGVGVSRGLPKGLTRFTLSTICDWIKNHRGAQFSTKMMADGIGISSVSCRKYLNYLSDSQYLITQLHYGTAGRPMYLYRQLARGQGEWR